MPELNYTTPPIYIEEISSAKQTIGPLPPTLPAFVGCATKGEEFTLQAVDVFSLQDFTEKFGDDCLLHKHLKLFFANGGGACKVVRVGASMSNIVAQADGSVSEIMQALQLLQSMDVVTLLAVPESVTMIRESYRWVVRAMLQHCAQMENCFAIIDVYDGQNELNKVAAEHRQDVGDENLRFGASYYPLLETIDGLVAPSAAVAGVICRVDSTRGMWKSPANEVVHEVIKPGAMITDREQQTFNVDAQSGKSINIIRQFAGRGTLIWGARTLAGNDNEWRYIPIRRYLSSVSHNIKKAFDHFRSEANEPATWIRIRAMVEDFLVEQWKQGALQGRVLNEGFYVQIGLGQTMTQADIDNGKMVLEVGVAMVRPAEFIVLRFDH